MTEDREYIKPDENLFSTGQKVPSEQYRDNWDKIEWRKGEDGERKPNKD